MRRPSLRIIITYITYIEIITNSVGQLEPTFSLVPADSVDEDPVTIEVDQGDGEEQGVPVELECRV